MTQIETSVFVTISVNITFN